MALGDDRRETFCLMCGNHRYNVPIVQRSVLDREDKERQAKYHGRGDGRRRLVS